MSKKRKLRLFGILAVVLVVAAGGVFVVQQKMASGSDSAGADSTGTEGEDGEKEMDRRVPVELAVASERDIPAYFQTTGSLEAKSQVELISKAQGQVTVLNVEEGDFVTRGQVLAELDPREEKILLEQARVSAETAQRELERMTKLSTSDLASTKDLDAAREVADRAGYEADLAQIRLDNKIIRAPFSGQITVRRIELGQTVTAGTQMFGIADTTPLEVTLYLPESVVKDLSPGQPVEIRPDIDAENVLDGRVLRIAPVVDPATSTVKITLIVDDESGRARVGSFVRARITTDVHYNVPSLPKKCLVPEAGATYVFVAEADSVLKIPVITGFSDDEYVEIAEGITAGDTVVTVGQGGLRNGSKIRDLAAEAAKAEAETDLGEPADTEASDEANGGE